MLTAESARDAKMTQKSFSLGKQTVHNESLTMDFGGGYDDQGVAVDEIKDFPGRQPCFPYEPIFEFQANEPIPNGERRSPG